MFTSRQIGYVVETVSLTINVRNLMVMISWIWVSRTVSWQNFCWWILRELIQGGRQSIFSWLFNLQSDWSLTCPIQTTYISSCLLSMKTLFCSTGMHCGQAVRSQINDVPAKRISTHLPGCKMPTFYTMLISQQSEVPCNLIRICQAILTNKRHGHNLHLW